MGFYDTVNATSIPEKTWEEFKKGEVMLYVTDIYTYSNLSAYMIYNEYKFRVMIPAEKLSLGPTRFEAIVISCDNPYRANGRLIEVPNK